MFSPNPRAALDAYRNVGAETGVAAASPQRLVLMLYEGALAAIASAQHSLRLNNIAAKGASISQAIAIIGSGLRASLDPHVGGELAQNLSELYLYMERRLLHANLKNDAKALEEVRQLLQQLYGAWEELAAKGNAGSSVAAGAPQPQRAALSYGNV